MRAHNITARMSLARAPHCPVFEPLELRNLFSASVYAAEPLDDLQLNESQAIHVTNWAAVDFTGIAQTVGPLEGVLDESIYLVIQDSGQNVFSADAGVSWDPELHISSDLARLDLHHWDGSQVHSLDSPQSAARRELVFVDSASDNYQKLLEDIMSSGDPGRELEVVLLSGDRDGMDQITEALAGRDDLDAIHIVSHGTDGAVQLGNTWLSADNIAGYADQLAAWRGAVATGADLLFYGCDLASTEDGRDLMRQIGAASGCDVAASDDLTGHESLGGDWDLEFSTGAVESAIAFSETLQVSWLSTLAAPTSTDPALSLDEDATYTFASGDFNYNDGDGDPFTQIQITSLETAGDLELNGSDVTLGQVITVADIDLNLLTFDPVPDASGTPYASFSYRVHDGGEYSAALSTADLINTGFDADEDSFTYADDPFGTGLPGYADGTYEAAGGLTGGGIRTYLGPGSTGGATSAGWSHTFSLTQETIVAFSLDFRMLMGEGYETTEYGEVILDIDGTRYGSDTNSSLLHTIGDGNGGGTMDSGWQSTQLEVALSAGNHTLTLGAYNNNATWTDEWAEVFFDNVQVTDQIFNAASLTVTAVNDEQVLATNTGATVDEASTGNVITAAMLETTDVDNTAAQLTYTVTGGTGNGTLRLSGTALGLNDTFTQDDIDSNRMTYDHDGSETLSDSFDFSVDDGAGAASTGTFSLTVTAVNDDSVVTLPGGAVNFTEGDGATVIDTLATVTDPDSVDLDTGTLTVDITANATANDRLAINDQGAGVGNISLSGTDVTYDFGAGAVVIGSFAGGTDGSTPLVITFNANATSAAAQALVRNITYGNTATDPSTAGRAVRFVLTDGDGGTSTAVTETVNLAGDNILEVTTTSDVLDGVTTSIDALLLDRGADGKISLREAIEATNNTANVGSPDEIHFEITDALVGGAHTIDVGNVADGGNGALPDITDAVIIDGSTDSDFAGTPIIELDGTDAGVGASGITITSVGSTIRGLVINLFDDAGIEVNGGSGNTIVGNYVGTDVTGTTQAGNDVQDQGVYIFGSSGNIVGGTSSLDRNVISGNRLRGVQIEDASATGNQLLGNYIGTNAAGTAELTNIGAGQLIGVYVNDSPGNTVGGAATGAGNLISGNLAYGFYMGGGNASGNSIQGNIVGMDAAGLIAVGNGSAGGSGLCVSNAPGNLFGGTASGAGNLIAGNPGDGIIFSGVTAIDNSVLGNSIRNNGGEGIDLTNDGVTLNDADDADAGANDLLNYPVLTNVVQNGSDLDIDIAIDLPAGWHRIEFFENPGGNDADGFGEGQTYLGAATILATGAAGYEAFAVTLTGVSPTQILGMTATATEDTSGGAGTTFGGTSEFGPAAGTLVVTTTGDVDDGDTSSIAALQIDRGADGEISLREAITAANNTSNIGGSPDEIHFEITDALVGGAHTIDVGNVADGSNGALPAITDTVAIDGSTDSNFAGTPVIRIDGASAGGGVAGLSLTGTGDGSTVRGMMITRFTGDGILVQAGSDNITIVGNWIGTAGTGTTGVGNSDDGIDLRGSDAVIGGLGANDGNVITNAGDVGIDIVGSGVTGHMIMGNYIGLDPDGSTGSGNSDAGIVITSGSGNTIGGTTTAARNVISNNLEGIEINTDDNIVQGNYIGTDSTGLLDRGNTSDNGVEIQSNATGNMIGGEASGAGNLIAFNVGDGISIVNGTGNTVLRNVIHSNDGLGIDLDADDVTGNDGDDGDTGANNLQNSPVLTNSATNGVGTVIIDGTFDTDLANQDYRIEFFTNVTTDVSGYGEAERYLGFTTVTTDGLGDASFNAVVSATLAIGEFITATATIDLGGGSYGDTSEFAENIEATVLIAEVHGTQTAPTVDGAVDAVWSEATAYGLNTLVTGSTGGAADFNGTWRAINTGADLYVLVEFTDDAILSDSGADYWDDDGIEIYLDPDYSRGLSYDGVNDYHLIYRVSDGVQFIGTNSQADVTGVVSVLVEAGGSGVLEFTIPWATLGVAPVLNQYVGIDVAYHDDDDGGVSDAHVGWSSPTDQAFQEPSLFGTGQLMGIPPVSELPGAPLTYIENDGAVVIDGTAVASDPDSTNFNTGTLTIDLISNGTANDRLAINNEGVGAGQIGVSGSDVTYGGTTIGTFAGGTDGSTPLVITFNTNSDVTSVQALSSNITYENVSEDPSGIARTVQFVLTDGDGGTSDAVSETISVIPVNDSPTVAINTGATIVEGASGTVITTAMLNAGDFDDSGSGLTYTITAATGNGTLRLSGAALGLNDTFTQDDLDNSRITYDHGGGEASSDRFNFALADGGEDGATVATGTFTFTITPVNDEQVLVANTGATVAEGSTGTVITTAMLETTDVDNTSAQLTYTVTAAVGNGSLRLSGASLGLNDSFTQDDIDNNLVTYDHNGSETLSDSFDFSVDDGAGAASTGTFSLTVTAVNDEQVLVTNTGATVAEGVTGTVITAAMLETTDADNTAAQLAYTVTTVTGNGTLRLSGTALGLNDTFTQDDIDNNRVTYDHDGSETLSDSFDFSVDDGAGTVSSGTFSLTVTAVNDEQVLATNTGVTVDEASAGNVITTAMLETTDADNTAVQLTYTVTAVTGNGTLRLSGTALELDNTFTQDDIDNNRVAYDHDGSETLSDSFGFSVDDGAGTAGTGTFSLTVTAVNDEQVLATNTGTTVNEASTGNVITTAMLETTDADNTAAQLTYTVTAVVGNGTLRLSGAALGLNDTFTQDDIDNNRVTYDHDGSETLSDSFGFSVDDGAGTASTGTFSLTVTAVNDAPVLDTNTGLTLNEGATATIGNTELSVSDAEQDAATLTYTLATDVANGTLYLNTAALGASDTFTQDDIDGNLLTYTHDGGETTSDGFQFTVSDGAGGSIGTSAFSLTVTAVNDEQVLATNTGTAVNEASTGNVITTAMLETTDADNTAVQLTYIVTAVTGNGTLRLSGTALGLNDTFTQDDIDNSRITYDHDGSETLSDSFDFSVDDGAGTASTGTFSLTVTAVNDEQVLATNTGATVAEASTGTVITNAMLATTDADNTAAQLTYTVTAVTGNGTLRLSGTALGLNDTFTQDDIDNNRMTYDHDGSETLSDSFDFSVDDGAGAASTGTLSLTVTAVNDDPVLTINPTGPSFTENGVGVFIDSAATVLDVDSTDFDGGTLAFTLAINGTANDRLFILPNGTGLGQVSLSGSDIIIDTLTVGSFSGGNGDGDPLIIIFNTNATAGYVESVTRRVAFRNISEMPSVLTRTVEVVLTDGDGGTSTAETRTVGINSVFDEHVLATNAGATINEGSTGNVIATAMLEATDVDNTAAQLTYTVTAVTGNGTLRLSGTALGLSDTFTQDDIDNNRLTYDHDGSETLSDSFGFSVDDGQGAASTGTFSLTVTAVNDEQVLATNTGTAVAEASTGNVITTAMLETTDVDNTAVQLTYTVAAVTGNGTLRLSGTALGLLDTFTQDDLDNSRITYDHDGSEAASDGFDFDVDDGQGILSSGTFSVTVTPVNDEQVLAINTGAAVDEGSAGNVITTAMLETTDVDNTAAQITYTVVVVTGNGTLRLSGTALGLSDTFTQDDIDNSRVTYDHDGSETVADSFGFTVDDGVGSVSTGTLLISVAPVNDPPTIVANTGPTVLEASAGNVITASMLNAGDPDDSGTGLTYTVTAVPPNGMLRLSGTALGLNDTFTQDDIDNGRVTYDHDGSETVSDSFDFSLADGGEDGTAATAGTFSITVTAQNDAPAIANNNLTISEGQSVILGAPNLSTVDPDTTPASLTYTVSGLMHGRFELITSPGVSVVSFTQAQVNAGQVRFVHDSGEAAPTYNVTVSDGELSDGPSAAAVTFTNVNDAPTIVANQLVIDAGETVTLGVDNVSAIDPDNNDTQLIYTATGVNAGHFALVGNPGVAITSFTQAQVNTGQVVFVHGGSAEAPSYALEVSDGSLSAGPSAAQITFNTALYMLDPDPDPVPDPVPDPDPSPDPDPDPGPGPGNPDPPDIDPPSSDPDPPPVYDEPTPEPAPSTDPVPDSAPTNRPDPEGPSTGPQQATTDSEPVSGGSLAPADSSGPTAAAAPTYRKPRAVDQWSAREVKPILNAGAATALSDVDKQFGEHDESKSRGAHIVVGQAVMVSGLVTISYLVWLFRGASIMTGALASMPVWKMIDPLAVLPARTKNRNKWWRRGRDDHGADKKDVESMFGD
jgi:uncharacterized protein DUF4347/cellulose/xylan binding protein with CBM9 domain/cadherin-like protein